MASKYSMNDRPSWPRRAIVTAGEPYGNKGLHFGHVGGVFVPADFFARFLRDRLGRENVIFTSGTDCYGSPIMESYRKLKENEGYDKSIGEYVESNHSRQAATLNNYNISCDIYGGSGLEPAAQIHNEVTAEIIERCTSRAPSPSAPRCSSTMPRPARSSTDARSSAAAPSRAASPRSLCRRVRSGPPV